MEEDGVKDGVIDQEIKEVDFGASRSTNFLRC